MQTTPLPSNTDALLQKEKEINVKILISELDQQNHNNRFDHDALWSSRTSPPSCQGVPQEQVLCLVNETKTNPFQFQKSSVTDNIQQVTGNCSSSRQSKTKFGWRNGGSLSARFPTIGPNDKVVLTAIPNVIAASFGTTKPQGDLDSVSVEFCQPRTRFGFRTLHQRHIAVKLNNYRSFHWETGVGVGTLLTDINTDFLSKIGGESSLLDTFGPDQQEASFPRVMKSEVMTSLCRISPTFALSTKIKGAPCFWNGSTCSTQIVFVESKSGQVYYHPSLSVLVYKHSNISSQ